MPASAASSGTTNHIQPICRDGSSLYRSVSRIPRPLPKKGWFSVGGDIARDSATALIGTSTRASQIVEFATPLEVKQCHDAPIGLSASATFVPGTR